jgi:membrane-associated phospholipid phosphatase
MRPLTMDRADALLLGGGLAAVGGAFATDHALRQLVLHHPSQTGRNVSDDVGTALGPGPLAGLSAGVTLLGFLGDSPSHRSARTAGFVALEAEGIAVVATAALKVITGRSTPDDNQGTAHFRPFSHLDGSFVSTHASASFAVATVFAERNPGPVAWTAYTLATAVSASRIYSDQHFGSDVLAGALLGWGVGYFLANRYADQEKSWQIRPLALERGMGSGVLLSHQF